MTDIVPFKWPLRISSMDGQQSRDIGDGKHRRIVHHAAFQPSA